MGLEKFVQLRKHDAGLYPDPLFLCIELDYLVKVFTEIDQDTGAEFVAGPAGSSAACGNRYTMLAGKFYRCNQVIRCLWLNNRPRLNPIQ